MKKVILCQMSRRLCQFVIIFFVLTVLAILGKAEELIQEGEIIVNKDNYTKSEVFSLNWGMGENEVGLGTEGEYKWGPQSFAIDKDGNIFIADTANNRVVKYSQNGQMLLKIPISGAGLFIDDNDNLIFERRNHIYIYDNKGNFVDKFHHTSKNAIKKIIKRNGTIMLYDGSSYTQGTSVEKKQINGEQIKELGLGGQNQGFPSKRNNESYKIKNFNLVKNEAISKVFKEVNPSTVIGDDSEGNIYITSTGITEDYHAFQLIQKFNNKNSLLFAAIAFSASQEIDMPQLLDVDDFGNIYQLYATKTAVKLMRWGK